MAIIKTVEWTAGNGFGAGYDFRQNGSVGTCVDNMPDPEDIKSVSRAYDTTYELSLIESSKTLSDKLGVSASVTAAHEGVGGSLKGSYASENRSDGHSVYCLLKISVAASPRILSARQTEAISLLPKALDLLKRHPMQFIDRFGNGFVAGVHEGGELFVLFKVKTTSEEDKKKITGEVNVQVGDPKKEGGKGTAKLKKTMKKLSKTRNVSFTVLKRGGDPDTDYTKFTIDEVLDHAADFGKQIKDKPDIYAGVIHPYQNLVELAGIQFGDVEDIVDEADAIAKKMLEVQDISAMYKYLRDNEEQFPPDTVTDEIEKKLDELASHETTLRAELRKAQRASCLEDIAEGLQAPETPDTVGKRLNIHDRLTALKKALPKRFKHLPRSADDIAGFLEDPKAGDYTIYVRDPDGNMHPTKLYCTFKDGDNRSYITLHAHDVGANVSYWPVSNKFTIRGLTRHYYRSGTSLKTQFKKIGFDPELCEVILDDYSFAENLPDGRGPLQDHIAAGYTETTLYTHAPYATASASNVYYDENKDRKPYGTASVDLTGTAWEIADGVEWYTSGFGKGGRGEYKLSAGGSRRQASLEVTGTSGTCMPKGPLKLKLVF